MASAPPDAAQSPVHDRIQGVVRTRERTYPLERVDSHRNLDGRYLWQNFGKLDASPVRVRLVVDDPDEGQLDLSFVICEGQRVCYEPDIWELSGYFFRDGDSTKVTVAFRDTGLFLVTTSSVITEPAATTEPAAAGA